MTDALGIYLFYGVAHGEFDAGELFQYQRNVCFHAFPEISEEQRASQEMLSQETFTKTLLLKLLSTLLRGYALNKLFSCLLLTVIIINGLFLSIAPIGTVCASTNVSGIISSNTTWTKANSPYNLIGNVLVDNGVTLVIEPDVTVNLEGNYIMVNGTLRSQGSAAGKVYFNGGQTGGDIFFTQFSSDWNNQTGTGSIIENANMTQIFISGNKSLKITNVTLTGEISVGESSLISDSVILGRTPSSRYTVTTGASSIISNNIINGTVYTGVLFGPFIVCSAINASDSSVISNNIVRGDITGNSITVTRNNVAGRILGSSLVVSSNTITGPVTISYSDGSLSSSISAIYANGGTTSIFNNSIYYTGYGATIAGGSANISVNTIAGSLGAIIAASDSIIEANLITDNTVGIEVGRIYLSTSGNSGNEIIRMNTITNNSQGIASSTAGGSAIIENNLIANNTNGISLASEAIIRNNTIIDNSLGIKINNPSPSILFNNIQSNSMYNVQLNASMQNDVNVTYNWWGTTNTAEIDMKIWDYYDDFNLGKVDYSSFLTGPNAQAMPDPNGPAPPPVIPEFQQSFIMLALIMATSFMILMHRRKR
jgi:hypothetical protein